MTRQLPLEGIRILDFSRLYPGPLCSLILSDMGAEVIKIEASGANGDMMRTMGNGMFQALNRGKKSITLNMKHEKDVQIFFSLLKNADVLIESFRPKVLENFLKIHDITELTKKYEKLVVARISSFGQDENKFQRVPAHDMNSLAYSGIFTLSDIRQPLPLQAVDVITAYNCASQIESALILRHKDGKGSIIDLSMADVGLSTGILALSETFTSKKSMSNGKDQLTGRPCYDIYETKKGFISVGCLEPHFWKSFVKILKLEDLASLENAFATGKKGIEVKSKITNVLKTRTAEDWEEIFIHPKVVLPVIRLRMPEELENDKIFKQRKMIETIISGSDKYVVHQN
eukprot:gene8093-12554_t